MIRSYSSDAESFSLEPYNHEDEAWEGALNSIKKFKGGDHVVSLDHRTNFDEYDEEQVPSSHESNLRRVDSLDLKVPIQELHPNNLTRVDSSYDSTSSKLSFILLVLAMIAIASGGTAYLKYPESVRDKPLMASQWRNQGMLFFLLPAALVQFIRLSAEDRTKLKSKRLWAFAIIASIGAFMWTGTWAVSLKMTTLTRAYLLNNCQPLIMVVWSKATGNQVTAAHVVGVLIGISGLLMTAMSSIIMEGLADINTTTVMGDGIAFSGAFFACLYIYFGGKTRIKVPSLIYLAFVTLINVILFTIASMVFEHTAFSSFIQWTEKDNLPMLGWSVLIVGLVGILLLSVVLRYLPSLLISVILLLEPIVASIIGIFFHVEDVPSIYTLFGATLITIGILIVTLGYSDAAKSYIKVVFLKVSLKFKRKKQMTLGDYLEVNSFEIN